MSIVEKNKCVGRKDLSRIKECVGQLLLYQISKRDSIPVTTFRSSPPSVVSIDRYLDSLYSDRIEERQYGALMILKLCCSKMERRDDLVEHHQLMSALSRTLQYEKSMQVVFIIAQIFLTMSSCPEYRSLLCELRVGATILKILEKQANALEGIGSKIPCLYEGITHVSLMLISNFSKDLNTQKKMVKFGLIRVLCKILRNVYNLSSIELALQISLKLSAFESNVHEMRQDNIVAILECLMSKNNTFTVTLTKLLLNLSFVKSAMSEIMSGMIPEKLVDLLKKPSYRAGALKLLYRLSTTLLNVRNLLDAGVTQIIIDLMVNFPGRKVAEELIALVINVSFHFKLNVK